MENLTHSHFWPERPNLPYLSACTHSPSSPGPRSAPFMALEASPQAQLGWPVGKPKRQLRPPPLCLPGSPVPRRITLTGGPAGSVTHRHLLAPDGKHRRRLPFPRLRIEVPIILPSFLQSRPRPINPSPSPLRLRLSHIWVRLYQQTHPEKKIIFFFIPLRTKIICV